MFRQITALLAGFMLLFSACSGEKKEVVVVYSPHGSDVLSEYKKRFEAAHPNVEVQMLDMGSREVYSRIQAEHRRPVCDVWWGAPSTMFTQAAKDGLLEPYTPSWADAVSAEFKDAENRWYATYRSPLAIVYNDLGVKAEDVPQTWDELLDGHWKGRISLRKPQPSGTMRTFISAMIARAENEDVGIAWLKRLHEATAAYPESPTLLYDHLKKNPERISVWLLPDAVMQRQLHGYPFGFVIPPDCPVLTDGIAIVKGAPHPEWARKFYEFVTTPEALAHQAKAYAKMPARGDIDPATLPEWMTAQQVDAMKIDWAHFAEVEEAWMKRWEREVYAR